MIEMPDWTAVEAALQWSPPVLGEAEPGAWLTQARLPDGRRLSVHFEPENGFMALVTDYEAKSHEEGVQHWTRVPTRAVRLLLAAASGSPVVSAPDHVAPSGGHHEAEQERIYREGDDGADYPFDPTNNPDGYK